MRDASLLLVALLSNIAGVSWLALAMDAHWHQVRGSRPPAARTAILLRISGVLALAVSLFVCARVDGAAIASLVWVMYFSVAALAVALTLAWRPRWLAVLLLGGDSEG